MAPGVSRIKDLQTGILKLQLWLHTLHLSLLWDVFSNNSQRSVLSWVLRCAWVITCHGKTDSLTKASHHLTVQQYGNVCISYSTAGLLNVLLCLWWMRWLSMFYQRKISKMYYWVQKTSFRTIYDAIYMKVTAMTQYYLFSWVHIYEHKYKGMLWKGSSGCFFRRQD